MFHSCELRMNWVVLWQRYLGYFLGDEYGLSYRGNWWMGLCVLCSWAGLKPVAEPAAEMRGFLQVGSSYRMWKPSPHTLVQVLLFCINKGRWEVMGHNKFIASGLWPCMLPPCLVEQPLTAVTALGGWAGGSAQVLLCFGFGGGWWWHVETGGDISGTFSWLCPSCWALWGIFHPSCCCLLNQCAAIHCSRAWDVAPGGLEKPF